MLRLSFVFALLALPASAQELASGNAIRSAISGNTVQGSMQASGGYTEFYAADGTIKAADYAGEWSISGDKMCFAYGEDPAQCWAARIAGGQITWVGVAGDEGTGRIVAGNSNGF